MMHGQVMKVSRSVMQKCGSIEIFAVPRFKQSIDSTKITK